MNVRELRDACQKLMDLDDLDITEGPVYVELVPTQEGECLEIHVQAGGYEWLDFELDAGEPPGPPVMISLGELIGSG